MNNSNNFDRSIDRFFEDFLHYRKTKYNDGVNDANEMKKQNTPPHQTEEKQEPINHTPAKKPEVKKNVEHSTQLGNHKTKPLPLPLEHKKIQPKPTTNSQVGHVNHSTNNHMHHNNNADNETLNHIHNPYHNNNAQTMPFTSASKEELAYMKLLYGKISKQMLPFVDEVLVSYDYLGSPIYNTQIDRDTISTIVDEVLYTGKDKVDQLEEVYLSGDYADWGRKCLIRCLVESLVLHEIFTNIRPAKKYPLNDDGEPALYYEHENTAVAKDLAEEADTEEVSGIYSMYDNSNDFL